MRPEVMRFQHHMTAARAHGPSLIGAIWRPAGPIATNFAAHQRRGVIRAHRLGDFAPARYSSSTSHCIGGG
jgi:hypothetical protein